MTSKDETITKNPDALLNGIAISEIITSCVPAVKKPKELLANDIDAIMIAIRHVTYGEDMVINIPCPECGHDNSFGVDLTTNIAQMEKLESEYTVAMDNGVKIYVKPFSYSDSIKALQAQFEQYKVTERLLDANTSDDERMKSFSEEFNKLAKLNAQIIANCIVKIVQEEEGIEVIDRNDINGFLENTEKKVFETIDQLIKDINDIGVSKHFPAKCEECNHEWEAAIDFNPVNFFTESS